jgi:hypothetical protein
MGIRQVSLDFINDIIISEHGTHEGVQMIELGNQDMRGRRGSAKRYFLSQGMKHISIDTNAKTSSIPLDLRNDNRFCGLPQADILTNIGTTEHVGWDGIGEMDQYMCFLNVHYWTKVNGVSAHFLPLVGSWPGHCNYYYTVEFFHALAKCNDYEVMRCEAIDYGKNISVICSMKKLKDNEFMTKEMWDKEIKDTIVLVEHDFSRK